MAILTGIDKKNPHAYRVVVGANTENRSAVYDNRLQIMVSRFNTMQPPSSANVDSFIAKYREVGSYGLVPAWRPRYVDSLQIGFHLALGKSELYVRQAWQIGADDPDFCALRAHDDPIIPAVVADPPVLRALQRKKTWQRHSA